MLNIKINKQSLKKAYLGQSCDYDIETIDEFSSDRLPDLDLVLLQIMLANYQGTDERGSFKDDDGRKTAVTGSDTQGRPLRTVLFGQSAGGIH